MKCIVLKAVLMISYVIKSYRRWLKASSARRSSSSPASYSSRWVEMAVEAAALRKWRRALKASSIAAGQRRHCVACLRRSGAIRRGGLGGKHLTSLGGEEAGSAVPGGEGQLAWQVRGKYWRQDVMGSEV